MSIGSGDHGTHGSIDTARRALENFDRPERQRPGSSYVIDYVWRLRWGGPHPTKGLTDEPRNALRTRGTESGRAVCTRNSLSPQHPGGKATIPS